jgi:hypothetical protein
MRLPSREKLPCNGNTGRPVPKQTTEEVSERPSVAWPIWLAAPPQSAPVEPFGRPRATSSPERAEPFL